MTDKPVREPTADHPITVEPTGKHVTVTVNGVVVAESDEALTLRESTYPAVQYIPFGDVARERAEAERHHHLLPVQGRRQLLQRGDDRIRRDTVEDVIWTYEKPYPAVGRHRRPCRVLSGQGRDRRRVLVSAALTSGGIAHRVVDRAAQQP